MVHDQAVPQFSAEIKRQYNAATERKSKIYVTKAGAGSSVQKL